MSGSGSVALGAGGVQAGLGVYTAILAKDQKDEAANKAKLAQGVLQDMERSRQAIIDPSADITNAYASLGVATQAAEMQAEEADIALANTLDTLRATGTSAGGATALAMAALKSKQGVSASIEQQEANNASLAAKGQMAVNQAKAAGKQWQWSQQESRDMVQLDRQQAKIDNQLAQENASNAAFMGALGNIGNAVVSGASNYMQGNYIDAKMAQLNDDEIDPKSTYTPPTGTNVWDSSDPTKINLTGNTSTTTTVPGGGVMAQNGPNTCPNGYKWDYISKSCILK